MPPRPNTTWMPLVRLTAHVLIFLLPAVVPGGWLWTLDAHAASAPPAIFEDAPSGEPTGGTGQPAGQPTGPQGSSPTGGTPEGSAPAGAPATGPGATLGTVSGIVSDAIVNSAPNALAHFFGIHTPAGPPTSNAAVGVNAVGLAVGIGLALAGVTFGITAVVAAVFAVVAAIVAYFFPNEDPGPSNLPSTPDPELADLEQDTFEFDSGALGEFDGGFGGTGAFEFDSGALGEFSGEAGGSGGGAGGGAGGEGK